MMYPLRDSTLRLGRLMPMLALLLALATPPAAAEDLGALSRALAAAGARDWEQAGRLAAQSGPIATDLVLWQRLRAGQGSWAEYRDFAARNADWPGMALFWRRGDALLRPDLPPAEVIAWFGTRAPDTVNGALALVAALKATDAEAGRQAARRFWQEQPLTAADAQQFLAAHGEDVADLHDARLAHLLDLGEWQAAQVVLPMASPAAQALGRARLALQSGQAGVDALILALPAAQQADAGLALDRFRWRVWAKLPDLARDLMLERSTSAEALRDPAAWAGKRADYARAALRRGDWALAERLAGAHFLPEGSEAFLDLEWLAGYGALRAGAADRALTHFQRLERASASPISLSRALYWQGRAHERAGRAAEAEAAFGRAAGWQSAWYGQLAAERLGLGMQAELALPGQGWDSLPEWRGAALRNDRIWQAGVWLMAAGQPDQGQRFFLHLAETAAPEDIGRMARLMLEMRLPWHALRLAKAAAAKGVVYPAAYFPLTGLEQQELDLPPELVMAIARRESEFNPTVASHAGALGLMQVMPDTARAMARRLGEPFDQARLTRDGAYNARLGAAYLRGLRERFGPSIALVAAGYNAGPGRSARWLQDFGDLRDSVDPVDWVEMIPFDETRNYVMRVAESLPIYRARIKGAPVPLVPSWDLTGGGIRPAPPAPPVRLAVSARPMLSARALRHYAAGGVLAEVLGPPAAEQTAAAEAEKASPPGTVTQ
ncbi:lytic transglycosylase domain-containing protein [Paracoccus sp. SMMA_5]|uniref:lytic transglycosylase domain-containing protein n=2 Tax=unclassified Paracoccus (in: a-proteobacteria) TaxID=2688777 RepID=UPI0021E1C95F|nr:lytic transglycosylase domain-containing protein [Paracoccus sp. SMMA_5]UXU75386.1 lytic transglycosylase domain-containing protein [Paracoccus sp. SMMA_5]